MTPPPATPVPYRRGRALAAGGVAFITWLTVLLVVNDRTRLSSHADLWHLVAVLPPWLIGLPVMRRLSMPPSAWFVVTFLVPFWLLARLTYRLVLLPTRDWAPAWWELDRVLPVPGNPRLWVLAPAPDEPAHQRLAPSSAHALRGRLAWKARNAWPFVFAGLAVMLATQDDGAPPWWLSILMVAALGLVVIAPSVVARSIEARRVPVTTGELSI